jgi:hypothetical protein
MWSEKTLRKMLPTNISLTTNMTMSTRTQYHNIIQKMTEPILLASRAMLEINIRATGRLHQQMQSTANINNNIELNPTTTINTPHKNEVRELNVQEAFSPFDTINRIELEALLTQAEHDEIGHMTLHTLDRFIQYNQYSVSNAGEFLLGDANYSS